jgi:hypothetical protein
MCGSNINFLMGQPTMGNSKTSVSLLLYIIIIIIIIIISYIKNNSYIPLSVDVPLLHARFLKRCLGCSLVGGQAWESPGCGRGQSRSLRQRRISVRSHVAGSTCWGKLLIIRRICYLFLDWDIAVESGN